MTGAFVERLEDRRLFAGTAITLVSVLNELDNHLTLEGNFHTKVSGHQTLSEPSRFILQYLKNTNPTVQSVKAHGAVPAPGVSTTFRLIVEEPTALFSSFPTTYLFTLNAKKPTNLFSIKQKDSQRDTMTFTGTFVPKTDAITGTLKVTGPNRALSATYSVAPTA